MIASSIDPLALPSVTLEERANLPDTPCIYFAIDALGVVQYIGKSKNPRQRWKSHNKGIEIASMGKMKIAYRSGRVREPTKPIRFSRGM